MKKIINLSKDWLIVMTMFICTVFISSCSSDDDDNSSMNEYENYFVGSWKSIDDDMEIFYLEFKSDRTANWTGTYDGKITDRTNFKNWSATARNITMIDEYGERETFEYSKSGNKVLIGDVLYQKQ